VREFQSLNSRQTLLQNIEEKTKKRVNDVRKSVRKMELTDGG
jgi:hypothetical protein